MHRILQFSFTGRVQCLSLVVARFFFQSRFCDMWPCGWISALHVDPAVVAAQPMMSSTVINLHGRTSPSSLLLPAFPRAPLINQSLLAEPSNSLQLPQQVVSHSALDLSASSHAFSSPIPLDHTRDSRIYSQNRLAHPPNLTDALFPSPLETVSMEQPPQHGRQMEPLHSSMESRSSFDEIPPSIPMPPDQAQQVNLAKLLNEREWCALAAGGCLVHCHVKL